MGRRGTVLSTGTVVASRYRLVRPVGEGAMGIVWEAEHTVTRKRLALKVLKSASREARARFEREVRATAVARHPNVVDVHDFVEEPGGVLCIVMDYLEGETLGDILRREGSLSLERLASMLVPAISAVGAAHALGIIHRDIKPDNVFVGGADGSVKVLDFGVAKLTGNEGLSARTRSLTHTGSVLGTPYYMSPEQVFSERDIDARADVWSFGVVLYECLSGVRPTEEENVGRVMRRIMNADFVPLAERCPELPEEIQELVMQMLAPKRDDRPRDLREVVAILERYTAVRAPSFDPPAIVEAAPETERAEAAADPAEATLRRDEDERSDTQSPVLVGLVGGLRRDPRRVGIAAMTFVAIATTGWIALRRADAPAPFGTSPGSSVAARVRVADDEPASSVRSDLPKAVSSVAGVTSALGAVAEPTAAPSARPALAVAITSPPARVPTSSPLPSVQATAASRGASARADNDAGTKVIPAAPPADTGGIVDVPPF